MLPRWPQWVALKTLSRRLDKKEAMAAHAVLEAGFWEGGGGAPIFRQWWNALRKDDEFDPSLVFLVMDREGVAAMAQCWTVRIHRRISPSIRAHDVRVSARALMLTVFNEFAKRGAGYVDLKVREENENAKRLYEHLGMRVIERDR